jgi:hypothetical protein
MLTAKASMFHLQCIILSKTIAVAKMLRQQKTVPFFQIVSAFQLSVTYSKVARAAYQAVTTKVGVYCMSACVQFQHSSLHCFGSSVNLQKYCENRGCSLTFFLAV